MQMEREFFKNPINVSGVYDQIGNEEFGNSWAEMLKGEKILYTTKTSPKKQGNHYEMQCQA